MGKLNGPTAQGQIPSINLESKDSQSRQEGSPATALLHVQTPATFYIPI